MTVSFATLCAQASTELDRRVGEWTPSRAQIEAAICDCVVTPLSKLPLDEVRALMRETGNVVDSWHRYCAAIVRRKLALA